MADLVSMDISSKVMELDAEIASLQNVLNSVKKNIIPVSKSLNMTAEWVDSRAPKDAFVATEPEIQNRFHTKPAVEGGGKCCSLS
mmetsp:Transcript_6888/g.14345  ORF Transcript_6888/g.14345 Transcript_6888/m.14345 type:complete len:85 (+) Transcript_6888:201-455(+)